MSSSPTRVMERTDTLSTQRIHTTGATWRRVRFDRETSVSNETFQRVVDVATLLVSVASLIVAVLALFIR